MVKRIIKRVVPLIAVFALVLNLAVVPQRARAVVATATVVAASAAAILTACGVSYWAATQTDAVDYITGKLEDYLDSIEVADNPADWLGISATAGPFEVIAGGALRFSSSVANKLLDFARWYQQEEGLESGGAAVGEFSLSNDYQVSIQPQPEDYYGTVNVGVVGNNQILVTLNGYRQKPSPSYLYIDITVPAESGRCALEVISNDLIKTDGSTFAMSMKLEGDTNSWAADTGVIKYGTSSGSTWSFRLSIGSRKQDTNGTLLCEVTTGSDVAETTARVTPSEFINIPSDIAQDATFDLTTSADITSTDDTDAAAEAIIDGITAEDGLTSEVQDSPGTSWGWLYTLLANIASTIGAGVSDIKDKLDGVKGSADDAATAAQGAATSSQGAAAAAQDAATAAQGVETAVEGLQSTAEAIEDNTATIADNLAPATYGDVADYKLDLTSLFPFCIPRDIYTAISLFASEPEAPSIDWDMPLPTGSTYHIHYDLSQWDDIASLLRHLELLLYGVGLMMATKSIIKW